MDPYKRQRLIELTRRWLDFVEEHPRLELPEINSAPMFNGLRLAVSACVRTPHELLAWLDALQSPDGLTVTVDRRANDRVLRVHQLIPGQEELQVSLTSYASRWDEHAGMSDAHLVDTVTTYPPTGRGRRLGPHGDTTVGQLRAAFSAEPAPAVNA